MYQTNLGGGLQGGSTKDFTEMKTSGKSKSENVVLLTLTGCSGNATLIT